MTDSAFLKIDGAAKRIHELDELIRETRPFRYVVETNTNAGERTLRPKANEAIVARGGLICGEILHNLRSALDHAYFEIISPHCTSDKERRQLQFPFTERADRLGEIMKNRYAHRGGTGFCSALRNLRPYGENGGNNLLYLIDELNIVDKHKLLIPTTDYKVLSDKVIRQSIPDFPMNFRIGNAGFTNCKFNWRVSNLPGRSELGSILPPSLCIYQRELDFPVDVVFKIGPLGSHRPMIATLNKLVDTARETIKFMRDGAATY
jgi:hypothetical protein